MLDNIYVFSHYFGQFVQNEEFAGVDLPSSILLSLQIRSTSISHWCMSEPWGVEVPEDFNPGWVLSVVEGQFWVRWAGNKPTRLLPGDSLLAPRGGACILCSSPGAAATGMRDLPWTGPQFQEVEDYQPAAPTQVIWGGGGAVSQLLGLAFTLQSGAGDFLLSSLPRLMIVKRDDAGIHSLAHSAMESLINDTTPGYFAVAKHLSELIIISLLRAHIFSAGSHTTGWLRGMQEPPIARVLSAIHTHPQREWTVDRLAAEANVSRSAFAALFARLVGQSPMQYLNQWRIGLAADQLSTTRQSVDTIARSVGFRTDRVFRRVFRQRFGMSPMQYRRHHRQIDSIVSD